MRPFLATFLAVMSVCALAACESASGSQYDGVSRFAGEHPFHGPAAGSSEPPPAPEIPARPALS